MDAETRETLEAMAECEDGAAEEAEDFQGAIPLAEEYRRGAAAIRAALAEVDALTQQVATLNRDRALMHADRIIDAATIADLEARAIPKELLDTRRFEIELCWHPLVAGVVARYAKPMANGDWQVEWVSSPADAERVELFPTLSAALSAAKEAP